jgi:lysophospholipase L1-like esterase
MSGVEDEVEIGDERKPAAAVGDSGDCAASFARFHCRAQSGDELNVVFFGGSITWGAGATDPQTTSYRPLIGKWLGAKYPKARFKFHDAAIGGTTSQLGAFRLDRDVLSMKPDLVFLDFALNDGMDELHIGRLASYEALLRRVILEAHAPVVLPLFPSWDIVAPGFDRPVPGLHARIDLAGAYSTPVGDVIGYVRGQIANRVVAMEDVWPNPSDHTHPGDKGYVLYAEAVWRAFEDAVALGTVCAAPIEMVYGDAYMTPHRYALCDLPGLPIGWRPAAPSDSSPVNDMKMSRWLDSVAVGRSGLIAAGAVESFRLEVDARAVLIFGESTLASGRYEVAVDGEFLRIIDASEIARIIKGDAHHFHVVSESLLQNKLHTIEITPILKPGQELHFESICVSGGSPTSANFSHLAAVHAGRTN